MSKIIENKILDFIKEKKIVKTKEIETVFNLSQSSTRRYLIKLEEKKKIERLFGEITIKENISFEDQNFYKKINTNVNVKKKIAKLASQLAFNYSTIYIDSGSLCYYLLDYLDKKVEIFTNSITNAKKAIEIGIENVNVLGGKIKDKTFSIIDFNENELKKITFPICFLGVNAIDGNGNIYTPEKKEAKAKNDIINHSILTVVLAEKEKFETISTFNFNENNKDILIVTNYKNKNIENEKVRLINIKE